MKKQLALAALFLFFTCRLFSQSNDGGHYFTSFDSTKIYYETIGKGYPVILVHGFSSTSQGWKNCLVYDDLVGAGFKVILIDQRGNGLSDKPHTDAAYANDAEAKDIMGLISFLNIKRYDAVGYSRGSIIVSRLMLFDKRVRRAVMGGMGDAFTNPDWPRRVHAYLALMGDTTHHDVDEMINYIHSQHFDELVMALQQKYQPSTSPKDLSAIKIPVLIIRGNEDKENGSETWLRRLIPKSSLVYVPGNHNTAIQTPEFGDAVLAFVR